VPGRFEALIIDLYERQYVGLQDVQLTQQWLLALAAVGYEFPEVTGKYLRNTIGQDIDDHHTQQQSSAVLQPMQLGPSGFVEGECCSSALIVSNHSRDSVCRFRRSRDLLVHHPAERPAEFGSTCLAMALDIVPRHPQYSVLVNVWNSAHKLRVVLVQLLKHTHGPWELIINFDGCEDDSYQVAVAVLNRMNTWPACQHSVENIEPAKVWQSQVNLTSAQGEIGMECWYQPSSLVGVRLLVTKGAGLFATASDNLKMLAARGDILVLVDDDQFMTVNGWNVKAAYPLLTWPDVFSVSMRCAHDFPVISNLISTKCAQAYVAHDTATPSKRCRFYVADSGNRGPLLLRADFVKELGYFDELHHMGVVTEKCDHDLNYRAYQQRGWVSGFVPVDHTEDRWRMMAGGTDSTMKGLVQDYIQWFKARRGRSAVADSRWSAASGSHNQQRIINDAAWHPDCSNPWL
jgi:glycosyltransferase involved in cell wall biosynthesis